MIVLFKSVSPTITQPIVIIDYTRSDEQYSDIEIGVWVNVFAPLDAATILKPVVYSLDYTATFTHSGMNYGNSLKQTFEASIINAPVELVKLLNIEQYASQQNISALSNALNNVIDPQVIFPTGGILFKGLDGSKIYRKFMVYSTPYDFDSRRINSTLKIKGSHFDSMVMRLQFAINIKKSIPLLGQIEGVISKAGLSINGQSYVTLASFMPVVDKYYSPMPLNASLDEICRDNNLAYDNNNGVLSFVSLSPNSPPSQVVKNKFSFLNSVPNTKMISSFSLNNYVSCEMESDIYDPELFSSITVFDDSRTDGKLFSNMVKSPDILSGFQGYRFYVQEYSLHDSRDKTSAITKGTNNWLLNNFKLDHLLENKIYQGAL